MFAIFVLLFLGFSLFLPGFLTTNNVALLLQSVSVLGILSVAMGATIIAGAIDLSMVALMVLAALLLAPVRYPPNNRNAEVTNDE